MTIGDVMGFSGAIVATGVTLWAAQVSCTFLYRNKTKRAAVMLETQTWKTLGTGIALAATAGVMSVILLATKNGLASLIGWVLIAGLLAHSVLGAAGLATLGGERIKKMAPRLSELACISRAAGLLTTAGFLPVFGWLFIFPVAFLFSLGAGWRALRFKEPAAEMQETVPVKPETVPASVPATPSAGN
ncbi:MAG: hypothetical protein OHK0029_29060 [Armatimonadaceae bacterium]